MRLAVVTDIHSNLPAWRAVVIDALARGVDSMICLGDVVGYGPWPVEVLTEVRARCRLCVLGNHDAAMVNRISLDRFRRGARLAAKWTRRQLDSSLLAYLRGLPLSIEVDDLLFVHAEPAIPEEFGYVDDIEDAAVCFHATDARLTFIGHTHLPALFVLEGDRVEPLPIEDQPLHPQLRYLINTGSVGDPRDGIAAASYVIIDDSTGWLEFRRCEFDLAACESAWAAVPELELPYFLRVHRTAVGGHEVAIRARKVSKLRVDGVVAPSMYLHAADLALPTAAASTLSVNALQQNRRWPRTIAGRVALALMAAGALVVPWMVRHAQRPAAVAQPRTPPMATERAVGAVEPSPTTRPSGEIVLPASRAERYGRTFRLENFGGDPHIGFWFNENDYLLWRFRCAREADYEMILEYALGGTAPSSRVMASTGRHSLQFTVPSTRGWRNFTEQPVGRLRLPGGLVALEIRPDGPPGSGLMNLRCVRLRQLPNSVAQEAPADSVR